MYAQRNQVRYLPVKLSFNEAQKQRLADYCERHGLQLAAFCFDTVMQAIEHETNSYAKAQALQRSKQAH